MKGQCTTYVHRGLTSSLAELLPFLVKYLLFYFYILIAYLVTDNIIISPYTPPPFCWKCSERKTPRYCTVTTVYILCTLYTVQYAHLLRKCVLEAKTNVVNFYQWRNLDSILQKKRCPPSFSYLDVLFIYGSLYAVFPSPGELERWAEPTAAAVAEQQLLRSSPFSSSVNYHNGGYTVVWYLKKTQPK